MWLFNFYAEALFLTTRGVVNKLDHTYLDVHQLLQERTFLNANNPKVIRALKYCSPLINGGGLGEEGN